MEKQRVVVIGGGTGTHTVLQGLKRYQKQIDLSAVVTMADSGGSTGRLRDEFGYLPVGDVRMALAALARDEDHHEDLLRQLFLHRFDKGNGLSGHNFGNLLLVALTDILGSEEEAIRAAGKVLRVEGRVVPVTTEKAHLTATYADGKEVTGEHEIDEPPEERHPHAITHLAVTPKVSIGERAEDVLLNADVIILGPGDLYTSVLANIVVEGVPDAIQHSQAHLMYVSNLMTKTGQTAGMGVAEHLKEIAKYVGRVPDHVLINSASFPKDLLKRYEEDNEHPVELNYTGNDTKVVEADLLATEAVQTAAGDVLKRSLIRHDSRKLAREIMKLI